MLVPSGLAAVTVALLVAARPGKKLLVPDNVYGPTRRFCDETLPAYGVETVYYDPLIGGGIADLLDGRLRARASKRRARTPSRCPTCRR